MTVSADVLVIGGGPAGAAAAIWAALTGQRVVLLERKRFPRERPGETLHPGVQSILEQLGVAVNVAAACQVRHETQRVIWAGEDKTTRFAGNREGPWRGYQILRKALDEITIARACECGVTVMQPRAAAKPLLEAGGRVCGIEAGADIQASFVVDATGAWGFLRRALDLPEAKFSPPLRAYYGYGNGQCCDIDAGPTLRGSASGWTWTARIGHRKFTWARLNFAGQGAAAKLAPEISGVQWEPPVRGADVTWRFLPDCAGPGYFVVGDAAALVDPASSHGVLRALMSGMMAAHVITNVINGRVAEHEARHHYRSWLKSWFDHDVRLLRELYARACPQAEWLGRSSGGA